MTPSKVAQRGWVQGECHSDPRRPPQAEQVRMGAKLTCHTKSKAQHVCSNFICTTSPRHLICAMSHVKARYVCTKETAYAHIELTILCYVENKNCLHSFDHRMLPANGATASGSRDHTKQAPHS